jgi:hypothetical protein
MQIAHLQHRNGGRITAVHRIEHSSYKRVAEWFFVADIEWEDGGKTVEGPLPPWALCVVEDSPEARAEYATLTAKLNDYLADVGEWHDGRMVNGMLVHWTPKEPKGSRAL